MLRSEKLDLTILLLITLLLSLIVFPRLYVISMDGAFQYIPMAKLFALGAFREAFTSSGQQPLYPFLVSWVSRGIGDFELAARCVSSFFGILLVVPAYFLGKRLFDRKVVLLSVLFLAVHPYLRRFSADALKESTYLFFFATALWFTLRALQREQLFLFLLVSIFSGLAYLVRPDGLEPLFALFFYIMVARKFRGQAKRINVILVLLLCSGLLLLPYLLHLKGTTGEWTLSKTKSITEFFGLTLLKDGPSLFQRLLYTVKTMVGEIQACFHPLFLLFMILGLAKTFSSGFRTGEGFLITVWGLHAAVLFLLILNLTAWSTDKTSFALLFSRRHILPLFLLSIYWMGEGFFTLHAWISAKAASHRLWRRFDPARSSAVIAAVLLVLTLAMVLPKTLKPERYERLSEKWAGIWIKNQSGKGAPIFTTLPRVAYYADGVYKPIGPQKDLLDQVHAAMGKKGATYLVMSEKEATLSLGVLDPGGARFMEVMRYEKEGMEKIVIYRRTP